MVQVTSGVVSEPIVECIIQTAMRLRLKNRDWSIILYKEFENSRLMVSHMTSSPETTDVSSSSCPLPAGL